jgi:hypothetical protein
MRVPIDSTIKANIVADVVSVGCVLRGTKLKTGAKNAVQSAILKSVVWQNHLEIDDCVPIGVQ